MPQNPKGRPLESVPVGVHEPESFEESYRVVGLARRTPTILELWLRPLATSMVFLPGQYVLLEDRDRTVTPRSYSIANAPRADGALSLLVTHVPDGQASTWIHERLRLGDDVSVSGPHGTFVDDLASNAPCLLLAAGSGLAPIRALIEAGLDAGGRPSLTLVFSARTEADVIDREWFAGCHARDPRFRFIRTLTRAAGPAPRGRIPAVLPSLYDRLGGHDVFIAGAHGFVAGCAAAVEALGADRGRVHTEPFSA
jgi:CDP-4-dehydro-6-deoxyglucose reductase